MSIEVQAEKLELEQELLFALSLCDKEELNEKEYLLLKKLNMLPNCTPIHLENYILKSEVPISQGGDYYTEIREKRWLNLDIYSEHDHDEFQLKMEQG